MKVIPLRVIQPPWVGDLREGPIAHIRNAAQIAQFAVDEARGLSVEEAVAIRNRLAAALEQLEAQ